MRWKLKRKMSRFNILYDTIVELEVGSTRMAAPLECEIPEETAGKGSEENTFAIYVFLSVTFQTHLGGIILAKKGGEGWRESSIKIPASRPGNTSRCQLRGREREN